MPSNMVGSSEQVVHGGEAELGRAPRETCGRRECSSEADCVDGPGGGCCCVCRAGTYGNGRECLPIAEPQRINGQLSGTLNGQTIPESDLHTYVVTSDGRAYTAISQVPEAVGPSLVLLNTIGNVMGWLFAKVTSPGVKNGFAQTGRHESGIYFWESWTGTTDCFGEMPVRYHRRRSDCGE